MNKDIATVSMVLLAFILIFIMIIQIISMKNMKKSRTYIEKLQNSLKPGVNVMLIGGIYGTIVKIDQITAIVNIAQNVDIKVDRSSIQEVVAQ
ncbi:preprotein translocase subunit YajC [uncultured Anaerococcus sp.]|uniref:preprotein translocase subunit YajC n=1 Tax=uncultured Anaerococcus sp. TaxID=293428 RepID=UPI00260A980C|nr:preprotein translocase subunit YajC [uncultured Anaerococcus sp.]